jgi:predicted  nucleic acid-binding Zn-ribbon protein
MLKKILLPVLTLFTLTAQAAGRVNDGKGVLVFLLLAVLATILLFSAYASDKEAAKKRRVTQNAEFEAQAKAEAKARAEAEAKARAEAEAKARAEAEAKARAEVKEKLDSDLIKLHNSLPFYTSNSSDEFSSGNGDDSRWYKVLEAITKCDTTETTLYLVKVRSLNDDNEYYKIGVTTQSIAARFLKSTDAELEEIIASHVMEKRLALFAEFHFIREFRPTELPDEGKSFSGYTEIVKKNSIKKIKSLFSTLPEYEAKASSFLSKALTDKS